MKLTTRIPIGPVGWTAFIPLAISAAQALISKSGSDKNQQIASNLQYQPIDLKQLQEQAHASALENAQHSLAIEKATQPYLSETRGELGSQVQSDLARGGNLPTDVSNQVTNSSITGANSAGLLGGAGPLTAASLGLTALQLRNMNQQKAQSLLSANPLQPGGIDPGAMAGLSVAQNNAQNDFNLKKAGVATNVNQSTANSFGSALGSLGPALQTAFGK